MQNTPKHKPRVVQTARVDIDPLGAARESPQGACITHPPSRVRNKSVHSPPPSPSPIHKQSFVTNPRSLSPPPHSRQRAQTLSLLDVVRPDEDRSDVSDDAWSCLSQGSDVQKQKIVYNNKNGRSNSVMLDDRPHISFNTAGKSVTRSRTFQSVNGNRQSIELLPNRQAEKAEEAKKNRKILDLEISNNSLSAINESLETQVRKQQAEISELKKKLSEFALIKYNSNSLDFSELGNIDDIELTEEDMDEERLFKRMCLYIESMIREGKRAISYVSKTKVLTPFERGASDCEQFGGADFDLEDNFDLLGEPD
ncbi:uncharacterized protein VTP21DRAFT_2747 [Calcarisporiella thermophila]|uniref:uncharacterized protein n=1 Tax=Calcarisporiella thermophila TaxID=911321 RepID=UPI0037430CE0